MDIPFLDASPDSLTVTKYRLIVDGLFGFSFKAPVRESFRDVMNLLTETDVPVISIDIPSGWNVESGPDGEKHVKPRMLISLTGEFRYRQGVFQALVLILFQLQNFAQNISMEYITWGEDLCPIDWLKNTS